MSLDRGAIRSFPPFADLSDTEIDDLRANLRPLVHAAGSTVCSQGDRDASLYLLVEGEVEIRAVAGGADGRGPTTLATRAATTVLGELGLLLDVPRTATIVARTDVVLWQITRESFYSAIARADPWAARLALAVASELAGRFVSASTEVHRQVAALQRDTAGPERKVAELARLRARLLAEWSF